MNMVITLLNIGMAKKRNTFLCIPGRLLKRHYVLNVNVEEQG